MYFPSCLVEGCKSEMIENVVYNFICTYYKKKEKKSCKKIKSKKVFWLQCPHSHFFSPIWREKKFLGRSEKCPPNFLSPQQNNGKHLILFHFRYFFRCFLPNQMDPKWYFLCAFKRKRLKESFSFNKFFFFFNLLMNVIY